MYPADEHLLGDNTNIVNKNKDYLIGASNKVGLEVNTLKSKYIYMCAVARMYDRIISKV
jgi:hypothetical protein